MWCKRVRSQLSAYADGELSLSEAKGVEEHLARCEQCAREHSSLQQLVRITSSIPAEEVPTGLHAAILTRLAYADVAATSREPRRRPGVGLFAFNPWMWTAVSGATAALVMGLLQKPVPVQGTAPVDSAPRKVRTAPKRALLAGPERETPSRKITLCRRQNAPTESAREREEPLQSQTQMRRDCSVAPNSEARVTSRPRQVVRVQVNRKPAAQVDAPAPTPPGPAPVGDAMVPMPAPTSTPGTTGMPGDPMVNSVTAPPAPDMLMRGMEKEPSTRMAGSPVEAEPPSDEDESVRALRLFLDERNRVAPQAPQPNPPGSRPLRKL